jgi:PHD/YefM family antitoxin component YafN of YafNO toxin-antitoxin module
MQTKYATGQAVLVPAIIRNAREENGVIMYEVEYDRYSVREDDIVLDDRANAIAFQREMERFNREIWR